MIYYVRVIRPITGMVQRFEATAIDLDEDGNWVFTVDGQPIVIPVNDWEQLIVRTKED